MKREDEWLFGWDETPGIVSVWADGTGHAHVFRRIPETRALVHEHARFRPWVLSASLEDLAHLGDSLVRSATHDTRGAPFTYEALEGPGALRFRVYGNDQRALHAAILAGASRRLGRRLAHVRDLGADTVFTLPPEEQYLVSTGRTYFRDLPFDALVRMQLDLETTGLDPTPHTTSGCCATRTPRASRVRSRPRTSRRSSRTAPSSPCFRERSPTCGPCSRSASMRRPSRNPA